MKTFSFICGCKVIVDDPDSQIAKREMCALHENAERVFRLLESVFEMDRKDEYSAPLMDSIGRIVGKVKRSGSKSAPKR